MARKKRPTKSTPKPAPASLTVGKEQTPEKLVAARASFSGPIPHPEIFRQYGEIIPDAPERILRVFEEDSKHTRDIQFAALEAQKADNKRTHWMAFGLIFSGFVLAGFLAWLEKDWLAGITLGTTLTGTIAGFIQGNSKNEKPG